MTATARLRALLPGRGAEAWQQALAKVEPMANASRKLRRIAFAPSDEELRDLLAELRYALVFASLGYTVTCEPTGAQRGPDFALSRADSTFDLEVRRLRPVSVQVSDELAPGGTLLPYGRGQADVRRAVTRVGEKFVQVEAGEDVIALWSDDDGIEEIEAGLAVAELREEARRGARVIPSNITWVVFGSGDIDVHGRSPDRGALALQRGAAHVVDGQGPPDGGLRRQAAG